MYLVLNSQRFWSSSFNFIHINKRWWVVNRQMVQQAIVGEQCNHDFYIVSFKLLQTLPNKKKILLTDRQLYFIIMKTTYAEPWIELNYKTCKCRIISL